MIKKKHCHIFTLKSLPFTFAQSKATVLIFLNLNLLLSKMDCEGLESHHRDFFIFKMNLVHRKDVILMEETGTLEKESKRVIPAQGADQCLQGVTSHT